MPKLLLTENGKASYDEMVSCAREVRSEANTELETSKLKGVERLQFKLEILTTHFTNIATALEISQKIDRGERQLIAGIAMVVNDNSADKG